jgi:hypothetical protein
VNAVAFGKDVFFHPRVPATRLMSEVRPGFKELFDSGSVRQLI